MSIDVIARVMRYMQERLEPNSVAFGGLPPCPYVRAERLASRICIETSELSWPLDCLEAKIRNFAVRSPGLTLLIVDPTCKLSKDEGIRLGVELCENLRDVRMIAICVHPDDPFEVAGFTTRRQIPYVTMLVQTSDSVLRAKNSLAKSAYYSNWSHDDIKFNQDQFGRFLAS